MNLGNELYFIHPFVSNSDLLKQLPPAQYTPDLRRAFARGTLLDAIETSPQYANFMSLRVTGYDWQYTQSDFYAACRMRDALHKEKYYQDLKSLCIGQEEVYRKGVQFEHEGLSFTLDCRIKYDLWSPLMHWGLDLKTTAATTHSQFLQCIDRYRYDQQRAFYMHVGDARRDLLVAVSWVNYKVFVVPIQKNDTIHTCGYRKMSYLAYLHLKSTQAA